MQDISRLEKYKDLIMDEINVKEVKFNCLLPEEISTYVKQKLKINFAGVGKRLSHKVKPIMEAVKNNQWQLYEEDHLLICDEILLPAEFDIVLEPIHKGVEVLPDGKHFIILDTNITEELFLEGLARDVVRTMQQARKDEGLQISDRINISVNCCDLLRKAIKLHKNYICKQTLCDKLKFELFFDYPIVTKIENMDIALSIRKS